MLNQYRSKFLTILRPRLKAAIPFSNLVVVVQHLDMFLPSISPRNDEHKDQGGIPKQQLPSIQQMFGESYPLCFPSRPSYVRPSKARHHDPPASRSRDHSNTRAPSNEQRPLLQVSTVESPLTDISLINDFHHPQATHPVNPTSGSVCDSPGLLRQSFGAENESPSPVLSQKVAVSRQQFCCFILLQFRKVVLSTKYVAFRNNWTSLYQNPVQCHGVL